MPALAIILPVRNAAATLDAAITSCLRQGFRDLELRLVLNGCSDDSPEIARRHAARDPRVIVSQSAAEGGIVAALNDGWQATACPWVMRMDADDLSLPDRAETQLALLRATPELAAVTGRVLLVNPQGDGMSRHVEWVNSLKSPQQIASGRFIECPLVHPAVMIRRDWLEQLGGYRQCAWAEDHDLWLRLLERGGRIGSTPATVLHWHDRPDRLTRSDPRYAMDRIWQLKATFIARLPEVLARGVAIAGAGPIGKRLARLLMAEGTEVKGFFEVNPRRIGQQIAGIRVADAAEIGSRWPTAVLLSAVGIPGGREQVRGVATAAGFTEGADFWCCC
jgi:glycosyltransferase involved in cell wall biosynthesis